MTNTPEKPGSDWKTQHLWQIQPVRDVLLFAAIFGILYLGWLLSVVTVPILIATGLAYLFEPLVKRLTGLWGGRVLSRPTVAMLIIVFAGLAVVIPATLGVGFGVAQGVRFAQQTATNVDRLQRSIEKPEDQALRDALPGRTWVRIRDFIVEEKHREDERNAAVATGQPIGESGSVPETVAPGTATPEPSKDSAPSDSGTGSPESPVPSPAPSETSETSEQIAKLDPTPTPAQASSVRTEPSPVYVATKWALAYVRENAQAIGKQALATGRDAFNIVARVVGSVGGFLFSGFLTAFFFFFICTGWGEVIRFWRGLIPERRQSRVIDLVKKMDRVIAGFIRGRLTICFALMCWYSLAYFLIGVPAPLILGPIVGVLALLPYVSFLGVPTAIVLLALEPGAGAGTDWTNTWMFVVAAPAVVFGVAQVMDDYVLTPRIQGQSTDMNTPAILFASLAGGVLAGVYGLLLAIPVAACLKILLKEVFWPKFKAWAEGRARDFLPIEGGESQDG